MFKSTLFWTAICSSLFTTLSLKFFHIFNFIEWSPVGWAEKWRSFAHLHVFIQWLLLFVGLTLLYALIYIGVSFTTSIPPSVTALIIAIIGVLAIEWSIHSPSTPSAAIGSVSMPLLALLAIVLRFITGTAVYMRKNSVEAIK
ncbi:hypothetical protein MHZ95_13885 [Sporosarcina sp. ACRSM]|uniref:hypothetical protein n=1 Tax=Sporosarcina sp. ACRSM TaxID=2918216 RepID=UPI001EF405F2|nr:hypothetical protein [Sporosarcina sp. ACRSM]MCG7336354.1 hypothetical protein [Sporosarcina sp. ACRSM]